MIAATVMKITVAPPTMPPAMAPTFTLLPLCEDSGEEGGKGLAELRGNEEAVEDVAALPLPVVFEGLPISAPGTTSGVSPTV